MSKKSLFGGMAGVFPFMNGMDEDDYDDDEEDYYDYYEEDDYFDDGTCQRCGKECSSNPKYCPICRTVSYCSQKCLKADKSTHKVTCSSFVGGPMSGAGGMSAIFGAGKKKQAASGAGYGGDGRDKQLRNQGKKQALKRETKTWKDWQTELQTFLKKKDHSSDDASSSNIPLNTLKQVLRCQAPDWWWKQPQRNLHITALRVCVVLTQHYPKQWGDPDDEESALAALEQLTQTSKLLVKQLENGNKTTANSSDTASQWLSQSTLALAKKNSQDKDASLPTGVLKIREEAVAAATKVLEAPELSMMGSNDYYKQVLRPLAFGMVEEAAFENPKHYYAAGGGHARSSYGGGIIMPYQAYYGNKKKTAATKKKGSDGMKASAAVLWKELSTYPTALPIEYGSSIFVRALENEMDKLRVLIIGPEDTPYANGCFLFDVSMGNDYPNAPPKVQFLTTSNFLSASDKKVRFNPNLYECGKVCLSLLGTWSGPSWVPKESTLLQVLVSLQSLILGTPDPYFNEPGYQSSEGTAHGKKASEQYNQNIRKQTVRVAILPFLQNQLRDGGTSQKSASGSSKRKDPPGQDATNTYHFAEFKDVIEQHFKLKKQAIRKQLFDWLQKDKSLQQFYTEYWDVCDQLDNEARLQAAVTSGTTKRQQQKRIKVDAPAVKMKDGVILLDEDDDDEDLQQALVNSMATTAKKPPKETGDGVILLHSDDDDKELNQKPAARKGEEERNQKPIAKETGDGVILLDSDDEEETNEKPAAVARKGGIDGDKEEKKEEPVASFPKGSGNDGGDTVDLTL